ncbi:hypothetical protein Mapa_001853 [Marchantia paleacea]|nr:hypothetical protein Mapa_001853 [Marchantia paleacea]
MVPNATSRIGRVHVTALPSVWALGVLLSVETIFLGSEALTFSLDQNADEFRCHSNVLCLGSTTTAGPSGQLSLISGPEETLLFRKGVAFYNSSARMIDNLTSTAASFTTSFTFVTDTAYEGGDGLAFFISDHNNHSGYPGGALGIFKQSGYAEEGTTLLAVEFDTHKNDDYRDADVPHVGLDINAAMSEASAGTNNTCRGFEEGFCTVWIDYDGATGLLDVRAHHTPAKPAHALLTYTVKLSSVFVSSESLWLGLSAGNGDRTSTYIVTSWEFNSFWPSASIAHNADHSRSIIRIVLIVAVVCGSVSVVTCLVITVAFTGRSKRRALTWALQELSTHIPTMYSFNQLVDATSNFSEDCRLGEGGFGHVYRGVIPRTHTLVAIKRLKEQSRQGEKEFLSEVATITQLRHRHVVQLLGWCNNRGTFMLVYEYTHNGSLDKALFESRRDILSWPRRQRIVAGVAAALNYLHEGWSKQVLHRDIKSSNILLDSMFDAKLGDFGLAVTEEHQKLLSTTFVVGTEGYMAPEAAILGKYTVKTDVYAFGVVVLETASARRAIDSRVPESEMILVNWVWRCFREGDILRAADPLLEGKFLESEMRQMLLLGLLCANPDSRARPSSRQIIQLLSGEAPILPSVDPEKCLKNCRGHFEEHGIEIQD